MRLVIDANVLFSALIKDSISANLIVSDGLELFAPFFIFDELEKYRSLLLKKANKKPGRFDDALGVFKRRINIIGETQLLAFMDIAGKISPDSKDTYYFAAAVLMAAPIWSNDKALKKQDRVQVYNTKELMDELGI
jgi:predicted nucleic acid-binding protein